MKDNTIQKLTNKLLFWTLRRKGYIEYTLTTTKGEQKCWMRP